MPASMASLIAGFSESLSAGLMSMMLTPFVIKSRIWACWPAASVFSDSTVTPVTLPSWTACALAGQIIASRQPLPTAPGFEMPTVYGPPAAADAAALASALAAALGAAALGAATLGAAALGAAALGAADDPVLEHALAITAN